MGSEQSTETDRLTESYGRECTPPTERSASLTGTSRPGYDTGQQLLGMQPTTMDTLLQTAVKEINEIKRSLQHIQQQNDASKKREELLEKKADTFLQQQKTRDEEHRRQALQEQTTRDRELRKEVQELKTKLDCIHAKQPPSTEEIKFGMPDMSGQFRDETTHPKVISDGQFYDPTRTNDPSLTDDSMRDCRNHELKENQDSGSVEIVTVMNSREDSEVQPDTRGQRSSVQNHNLQSKSCDQKMRIGSTEKSSLKQISLIDRNQNTASPVKTSPPKS
ncbi:hypothetical protein ScPMuIL_018055 [Solemya velum]